MATRQENRERKRQEMLERMRNRALARGKVDLQTLPAPLPVDDGKRLVRVFVEGYEDVAFWRGIFDHFANPYLRFEISVPTRKDLPKGKKVLLSMAEQADEEMLLCMDSDFDYLLSEDDEQSRYVPHLHLRHRELSLLRPVVAQCMREGGEERCSYL